MGKREQRKGAAFEREVVNTLKHHGFPEARRTAPMQRYKGLIAVADVDCHWPLFAECKDHKTLSMPKWIRQVEKECPPNKIPAVIFKIARRGVYITLPFEDYLQQLYGDWPNGDINEYKERLPQEAGVIYGGRGSGLPAEDDDSRGTYTVTPYKPLRSDPGGTGPVRRVRNEEEAQPLGGDRGAAASEGTPGSENSEDET